MPEAPAAERVESHERAKPSPALMLSVAHGEFDTTKLATLDKKPTRVADKSFSILEAQHQKVQQTQALQHQERAKKILMEQQWPESAITPELLRHMHMADWAKTQLRVMQVVVLDIHKQYPHDEAARQDAQKALGVALEKLGIHFDDNSDVAKFPDQFYKTTSDTSGTAGEFYSKFCTGDINSKLMSALTIEDMVALKHFLAGTLGSYEPYDALLATKQTQDALDAKEDFTEASLTLQPTDAPILSFFQQGEELLTSQPKRLEPQPAHSESSASEMSLGEKTEVNPEHPERNEDTFFLGEKGLIGGIFDGAGSYEGADKASQEAQRIMKDALEHLPADASEEMVRELFLKAFKAANEGVKALTQPGKDTGTTAVAFRIMSNPDGSRRVIVGNVGDSRAWIRKADGSTRQITRDGGNLRSRYLSQDQITPTEEQKEELSTKYNQACFTLDSATSADAFKDNPFLSLLWNQRNLTNLLGSDQPVDDIAEIFESPLEPGDTLFLTTDGIHDNLTLQEIHEIAREASNPQALSETLVARAKEVSGQGGFRSKVDDITAVAVGPSTLPAPLQAS